LTLPKVRADVLSATEAMDIGLIVPAAGFGSSGRFENASKSRERTMLELNCAAVLDLLFGFVPRLVGRGRGGIILWSSITAFQGVPNAAGYAATKAWNQSLAEALHLELKRHGIDVLASAPATVATGFAAEAGLQMAAAARPEVVARKTLSALGKRMTVRPGFLASFLEIALKLPRPLRARIMAKVMGGMAAKTPGPDLRSAGRV
jgi:short-subunit dehydrogenase